MNWDPDRKQPARVRCTRNRFHPDRCSYRLEDAFEWKDMPNMDRFRCDYEFIPSLTGTCDILMEGRDD